MANNFSISMSVDTGNAKKNIAELGKEFDKFDKKVGDASKALKDLDNEQDNNIQVVGNAKKQYKDLMKQVANVTLTLEGMTKAQKESAQGKALENKLKELKEKAAEFQDALQDAQQEVKNLASDTRITDGLGLMARTFGDVSTAIVALGGDADNMKKVLMDIAKIQATVKAVESLTKAFQKQNLVLLKNPYVLVAAGIAAVGVALYEFSQRNKDASETTEDLTDKVKGLDDAFDSLGKNDYLKYSTQDLYKIVDIKAKQAELIEQIREKQKKAGDDPIGRALLGDTRKEQQDLQDLEKQLSEIEQKYTKTSEKVTSANRTHDNELKALYKSLKDIEDTMADIMEKSPNLWKDAYKDFGKEAMAGKATAPVGITPILEEVDDDILDELGQKISKLNASQLELFETARKEGKDFAEAYRIAIGEASKMQKQLSNTAMAANMAGTVFNSLGSAMQQPVFNVLGTIAQAVANIALAYSDAFAKDQTSKLNIFAFIASVAAGVASMVATITAVKKAGTFADGGIIQGATSIGDFNLARVNSGEMILNGMQQARLFNLLQGSGSANGNESTNNKVEFKIKGQELVGVLANYSKKQNKAR